MANPNPKESPDWRERGWETFEGGRNKSAKDASNPPARDDDADIWDTKGDGGNYAWTHRNTGYPEGYENPTEPRPEKNFPQAYNIEQLMNPDLNPAMEVPQRLGATLRIMSLVVAILLFGLLIALIFYRFQTPSQRSPDEPRTGMNRAPISATVTAT